MSNSRMPLSCRREKGDAIVLANAPPPPEPGRRPYLLKMLQEHLGTYLLADTLDWEALTHFNFDATMLSLDDVYKGLRDKETYYFLWVAVRKVLEEAPNVTKFSGARVAADQKTKFLNGLLDATLEQLLVELGDALMNFVEGPHCTVVDPRIDGDARALRTKARSLVTRFEKLGRSRDTLMVGILATEAGIEAAASLKREDGINVNLTSVSGVMHAAACARAGAVAVTLPIAKIREWYRTIGREVAESREGPREEDAETIAAYFELHDFSPTTGLIVTEMDDVDDACPHATLAALGLDAQLARKAEWYTAYPKVRRGALPRHAVQRAGALPQPPPLPPPGGMGIGKGPLGHLDAWAFSAFAGITCGAVGSGRASMSMIADVARREIEWQFYVMQPLCVGIGIDVHPDVWKSLNALRRGTMWTRDSSSSSSSSGRVSTGGASANATAAALVAAPTDVPAARARLDGPRDHMSRKKRKRGAEAAEVAAAPDSPTPPEKKRARRASPRIQHNSSRDRDRAAAPPAAPGGPGGGAAASAPLQRPLTPRPPAGPVAAFLYALGSQELQRDAAPERPFPMVELGQRGRRGAGRWR